MKILIAVASTYGSTQEMAGWVADELTAHGHSVTTRPVHEAGDLGGYDAVILGTAVYIGRLLTSARQFATRLANEFEPKPVWVFASGMKNVTRDPLHRRHTSPRIPPYIDSGYPIFGGKVDRDRLGPAERALAGFMGERGQDRRDRELVAAWAREVAAHLSAGEVVA